MYQERPGYMWPDDLKEWTKHKTYTDSNSIVKDFKIA